MNRLPRRIPVEVSTLSASLYGGESMIASTVRHVLGLTIEKERDHENKNRV